MWESLLWVFSLVPQPVVCSDRRSSKFGIVIPIYHYIANVFNIVSINGRLSAGYNALRADDATCCNAGGIRIHAS
jgi:hypothetical protein